MSKYLDIELLETASDEEIVDAYDWARGDVSYYNAAESSWGAETTARHKAVTYLNRVYTELSKRKLTVRPGNYLC